MGGEKERAGKFVLYVSSEKIRYIFVLCSNKNKVRKENKVFPVLRNMDNKHFVNDKG
jgi:hypothetical protein